MSIGAISVLNGMLPEMKTTVPWPNTEGRLGYGLGLMRLSLTGICGPNAPVVWGHGGDVPGFCGGQGRRALDDDRERAERAGG